MGGNNRKQPKTKSNIPMPFFPSALRAQIASQSYDIYFFLFFCLFAEAYNVLFVIHWNVHNLIFNLKTCSMLKTKNSLTERLWQQNILIWMKSLFAFQLDKWCFCFRFPNSTNRMKTVHLERAGFHQVLLWCVMTCREIYYFQFPFFTLFTKQEIGSLEIS